MTRHENQKDPFFGLHANRDKHGRFLDCAIAHAPARAVSGASPKTLPPQLALQLATPHVSRRRNDCGDASWRTRDACSPKEGS
jgi:hypothetical protein